MNFYEALGVERDADRSEIRAAYRRLSREYHPDVNDHPRAGEQFRVLTHARDVLTDPEERDAYDRLGHHEYVRNRVSGGLPDVEFDHAGADGDTGAGAAATSGDASASSSRGGAQRRPDPSRQRGPDDGRPSGGIGGVDSTADATSRSGRTHSTPPPPDEAGTRGTSDRPTARDVLATLRGHLTVSARWMAVLAAAALYGTGLAGYLRAGDEGVGRLLGALAAGDPRGIVAAVGDAGYELPGILAHVGTTGVRVGVAPTDAPLLVAGVVLLPVATTAAVVGLRRRTTWRPSGLYVLGAFGPAASVIAEVAAGSRLLPVASVPLSADLLLLVALPGASVAAFLLTRLVLVVPLRRREDLGPP